MTSSRRHESDTETWWQVLRRDPVLLSACVVLTVVALGAAVLTGVDRTPARAGTATGLPASVPPTLSGGEPATDGRPRPSEPARSSPSARSDLSAQPNGSAQPDGSAEPYQPGQRPSSGSPARCPESGVAVRVAGGDAAMGLRALVFELLNCGALPYRVKGHPAVRLLGPDRTPLSAEIIEGRSAVTVLPPVDAPPAMVTLRPGERAEAVLVWRTTAIPGPADRATYFEVTARAGDEPQIVDPVRQLDIGTGGRLGIGPWARRAAG